MTRVTVDLTPNELARLDEWRRPKGLHRDEAFKVLVKIALRHRERYGPQPPPEPGARCTGAVLVAREDVRVL
jgi:hypothetical protein